MLVLLSDYTCPGEGGAGQEAEGQASQQEARPHRRDSHAIKEHNPQIYITNPLFVFMRPKKFYILDI